MGASVPATDATESRCININAQSASLRSLVAAESTLQQPMQPARDHPLFCVGFECLYLLYTGIKVFLHFFGREGDLTLTFDLQRSLEVKNIFTIWKPMHDFLSNFYWHFLSRTVFEIHIRLQSFQGLTLTFRGHLRSKMFSPFESPYMTSYLTSIDTFSLSHTVFWDIWLQSIRVWPWPLEVTWGQKYFHYSKAHTWLTI